MQNTKAASEKKNAARMSGITSIEENEREDIIFAGIITASAREFTAYEQIRVKGRNGKMQVSENITDMPIRNGIIGRTIAFAANERSGIYPNEKAVTGSVNMVDITDTTATEKRDLFAAVPNFVLFLMNFMTSTLHITASVERNDK